MTIEFPPFLTGEFVRHTGKFLKNIGSPTGNPINGKVTNSAVKFGAVYFVEVHWCDASSPVLVNPVNIEKVGGA